jgi:hypothetical protein
MRGLGALARATGGPDGHAWPLRPRPRHVRP